MIVQYNLVRVLLRVVTVRRRGPKRGNSKRHKPGCTETVDRVT